MAQRDMTIQVLLCKLTTKSIDTILDRVEDNHADFDVSRFGERLAASNPSFDDLYETLQGNITCTEQHNRLA